MGTLLLVHWNAEEAESFAQPLRASGWEVEIEAEDGHRAWERVKNAPPEALVVYLQRLPSHGRETARAIRKTKAGRDLPILFVGGDEAKLDKVRQQVPDGIFIQPSELVSALSMSVASE